MPADPAAPTPPTSNLHDPENVVGNFYDKYQSRNPIARLLMRGFMGAVTDLFERQPRDEVLEVGCGEGELAQHFVSHPGASPRRFVASDISLAQRRAGLSERIEWREASIYELPFDDDSFDLVICCEVLEHIKDPARGLQELARVSRNQVLLSTPWEPVWRGLNMARGKYWRAWGNTPGHIQHFSRRGLIELASSKLRIRDIRRPLPWTVILGDVER